MKATVVSFLLLVTAVTTFPDPVAAQAVPAAPRSAAEPIQYTVSFPAPHTHYAEVTAVVPTSGRPTVELMMAVWTPGSYLVREFERNVENVMATASGRALVVEKSDKNRWRITTTGCAAAPLPLLPSDRPSGVHSVPARCPT